MATLIRVDGTETEIATPSVKEIARLIGASVIDIVRTDDGRAIFVDDADIGKILPVNAKATAMYRNRGSWSIRGDVVVFSKEETEADEQAL